MARVWRKISAENRNIKSEEAYTIGRNLSAQSALSEVSSASINEAHELSESGSTIV